MVQSILLIRCGQTRSGKSIYEVPSHVVIMNIHPAHGNFQAEDHFDAYAVFSYITSWVLKRDREDPRCARYSIQAQLHRHYLESIRSFDRMNLVFGIETVFDLIEFAKPMVDVAYRT